MGNSGDVVEKIRKLREERDDLLQEMEEMKKLANSEEMALENEVRMLRKELWGKKRKRLTRSKTKASDVALSMVYSGQSTEEPGKFSDSRTTALQRKIDMLHDEVIMLKMDLPYRLKEDADRTKKPWWRFFR